MGYGFGRINDLAHQIHLNAVAKGFYDGIEDKANTHWLLARLMLVVSELAEGCEGVRHGNLSSEPQSGGLGEELADAIIRILDMAESVNINIEQAIINKIEYNNTRPTRHGGKLA